MLEVGDIFPSGVLDQLDISESLLFPKLEDFPVVAFPGILAPCKVESDSQEFTSLSVDNEGEYHYFSTSGSSELNKKD